MSLPLFLLLCIIPAAAFWVSGRAAAENASLHGRQACKEAGVQWLDQSVHQLRVRLRRNADGRLCWERQYRFEYSHGGDDRHAGLITMLGSELGSLVGPMRIVASVP
jgi:hypothetical protein